MTSMLLVEPSRTLIGITNENSNIEKRSFLERLLTIKKNRLRNTLEEIVDVDKDLEIHTNHQVNLLNSQIIYRINALNFNT